MSASHKTPGEGTVGELFIGPDGQMYRQVAYCSYPSVDLENVLTGRRTGGAVHSAHVGSFRPPTPEEIEQALRDALEQIERQRREAP